MKRNKLLYGHDVDTFSVRYCSNIKDSEKVIGLTDFIENEYDKVLSFASQFFQQLGIQIEINKIPIILKKEKPKKKYHTSDKTKTQMLLSLFERYGEETTDQQIYKTIHENSFVSLIGGKYYSSDKFIEIYYQNIDNTSVKKFYANLAGVLAHEYMHYIHDIFSPLFNDSYQECEIVKESIADFFSFLFLIYCNEDQRLQVSYDKFILWSSRLMSPWIYAYALYFRYLDGGWTKYSYKYNLYDESIEKFKKVLKASRYNMYEAMIILLK